MPIPVATVNSSVPRTRSAPIRTAAVAPVKPTWARAWLAKDEPPQDDEVADDPGADRRQRGRQVGVAHERLKEYAHLASDGLPRE